jgi:hypothetical protein
MPEALSTTPAVRHVPREGSHASRAMKSSVRRQAVLPFAQEAPVPQLRLEEVGGLRGEAVDGKLGWSGREARVNRQGSADWQDRRLALL